MSWWNEDEARARADESRAALKESWGRVRENIARKAEEDREWYEGVDALLSDPASINLKTDEELIDLKTRTEIKVDELEGKLTLSSSHSSKMDGLLRKQSGGGGLADVLSSFSDLLSTPVQARLNKNRQLLKLIKRREERDRVALPEPSKAQKVIAQQAHREAERQELISLLEKQRDEQKSKYPEQADSIDRRYRKLIDAAIEQE